VNCVKHFHILDPIDLCQPFPCFRPS